MDLQNTIMKRDMELIRMIMLECEAPRVAVAPHEIQIEGYGAHKIGYHVWLLGEAGLLVVAKTTHKTSNGPQAMPVHLTWEGHDFVDAIRDDTVWKSVRG